MYESEGREEQRPSGNVPGSTQLTLEGPVSPRPTYLTEDSFKEVLAEIHERCFLGKGVERHADGGDFRSHDFWDFFRQAGHGFAHGQVLKKVKEFRRIADSGRIPVWPSNTTGADLELVDACVYLVAMILWHRETQL